jgi:extracellular elastinolytic metalloproteinase
MIRSIYTFSLLLLCSIFAIGQAPSRLALAVEHIKKNATKLQLTPSDVENLVISSEVTSEKGITYMYLNQTVDNVEIRNAVMTVIIDAKGQVVSDMHSFVSDAAKKVSSKATRLTAPDAILKAAEQLNVKVTSAPIMVAGRTLNKKAYYAMPELATTSIGTRRMYELKDDKLVLVWNLHIDMRDNADYWDYNVDANTGDFVSKHNFTLYCTHHKGAYDRHDNCQIDTYKKMTGNQVRVQQALNSAAARYNVFKLPAESPNHGGRQIATDDQFPLYSPFGWHDTDGVAGAEFTFTRGNNVYAYPDKDDDDESDEDVADGGAALNFDFPYNGLQDPRQSDKAAITNLFYMVNMLHDVTAATGFTEEFGNFQAKNYSGKAQDGEDDYVLAQAFDGITLHENKEDLDANGNPTKINNANFSTPDDGFNGRMQMFFWDNSSGGVSIDAPAQIAGFVSEYGAAQFGNPIPSGNEAPIVSDVVIATDNSPNPNEGCEELANSAKIAGKIAMINRGICQFGQKALKAQEAGAVACIICNVPGINGGNGEELIGMAAGNFGAQVNIPTIMLKNSDCARIKFILNSEIPVTMTWKVRERVGSEYIDGSLDNGIIAHEFGHGISNRLTGGRFNSGCLGNNEQQGEGWSDYFSLIMTHEPGDKGSDIRGIGTFAQAQSTTGGGIRRFPYSTDMNINPQTFDDIKGTTAPHPLGEVWADMLWDMYWAMIDEYGYDPNWANKESGNYKAVFLVMEGMKMQPCNPGFVPSRDAIFKADKVHFNEANKCLLWKVFARRGLGVNASGGLTTDRNDGVEDFTALPTCIEELKITKTITSSVVAGGVVDVTIKATNHIKTEQKNVVIEDQLDNGMTFVSGSGSITPTVAANKLTFNIGEMEYDKEYKITYKATTNINNKSVAYVEEKFEGDIEWDINVLNGSEFWGTSNDAFKSPETSFRIFDNATELDAVLISKDYSVTGNNPVLRFWHRFDTEAINDGGFVEISVDGGPFKILKNAQFLRNGYNGDISYSTLAIPSLQGFSGSSNNQWVESFVNLAEYKGKTCKFRFRFVCNTTIANTSTLNGWFIDDFALIDFYRYTTNACIYNDNGPQTCTAPAEVFVIPTGVVSTEDETAYFDITLSPNPTSDKLVITASAPVATQSTVFIMGIDGKVLSTHQMRITDKIDQMSIPVQHLAAGMYMVKIQAGSKATMQKFVKQ